MIKNKKLVIVGLGETAEIAYEYFTYDSPYEVSAFSVNREYIIQNEHFGLPVVAFEEIETYFDPSQFEVYVAVSYVQLNRVRKNLFLATKKKGFTCANYISSKAFVWRNVKMGENNFIFENNIILWSGNHIGHQTKIKDHVYISSHCVISGFCEIGEASFIGVNSTFNDNVMIAEDTIVGSASLVNKSYKEKGHVLIGTPAKTIHKNSYDTFNVIEDDLG